MAGALVGGAFLSAFLQVAFDRLASPDVLDFFKKRKLNEKLLDKLNFMLKSIDTVVDDAEQRQIANPNVKDWIDMIKDAVYDAEDVLDQIDYEMCKRQVGEAELEKKSSAAGKVRNFFSASISSFEKEIESRMKEVLENLEYLASQKDVLRLKERSNGAEVMGSSVSNRLPTTSLVDEAGTYGRDNDRETIIEWLLSGKDDNKLSVISIVGMGGLGKSTLAQLVYNDGRFEDEFDLKVWVCVSDKFDVLRVTRTIVEAITMSKDDKDDLNMLQIKLKQLLTQKRFLLVLDDVWNEDYMLWEALQSPFNYGAPGSKILLTTRSTKVVSTMHSTKILLLKPLSERDSWSLFRGHVFHNEDAPHLNSDLEEIGRKIIKRCKGLPLALKAIGSLLHTKLSNEQWNDILKSEIWEEKSHILPALRLSYHYLPSLLKRCFAYCSIFPKDYDFDKELLIRLWMAENFLPCAHPSRDARGVGEQFFHDLWSRSFFQRSTGDEMRFVMHDLINDLAKDEYGKFCHRLEVDGANNLTKMIRHISYLRGTDEAFKRFEIIFQATRLRTFLPLSMQGYRSTNRTQYDCWMSHKLIHVLSTFSCMRVLSLSDYSSIVELPDSIGNLKCLRYLDLSHTKIKKLPDSICQLYHLQTLKLWRCDCLEELATDLHKLMNLRHLDFRRTQVREMPKQLGKLTKLQMLSSFIVGKCRETNIKQLKELNLWRSLSILNLQNVINPMDALVVNLKAKIHLEKLTLEWSRNNDESQNDKDVLEKLQPHLNLKKLSIRNYGGVGFPNWFADHSLFKIVSLKLSYCKYSSSLPSLDCLPSLKSLSIIGFDRIVAIGQQFHGKSSNTTSLEILRFGSMKNWEEWKCEILSGAFPHLQELYIEHCPKLKEHLPPHLPSLRKLVIKNCGNLVASVPRAPSPLEFVLSDCGKVKLDCLPSTLKVLQTSRHFIEILSVEKIEHTITNSCLEELNFSDCPHLEFPLTFSQRHNFIIKMNIEGKCDSLKSFPLDSFPKLQVLELCDCSNLETISVSLGYHTSLAQLSIWKCPNFVFFPQGGFSAPKLELFSIIELENLSSLPERMHSLFPSLRRLFIANCPQMASFPDGGLPSNLKFLYVSRCLKLTASRMAWDLISHTSLQDLWLGNTDDESLPEDGLLPSTLTSLTFSNCSNMRRLQHNVLRNLCNLNRLALEDCPKIQHFPKERLPSSLSTLRIAGCPLLKRQLQKQRGKNWAKISHIACVQIDDDIIT